MFRPGIAAKSSMEVAGTRKIVAQTSKKTTYTSYDERLAVSDKKQQRVQATLACVMFAVAGWLFYWNHQMADIPPKPNATGYYEGPWVNKRGDLVGGDGKILQKNYRRTATSQVISSVPSSGQLGPNASWVPE